MKILILGASSYVGARLYFDLKKDHEVVDTYSSNKLNQDFVQLDVTDQVAVRNAVQAQHPDVIVHVANNPSRAWCDLNPEKAIEINQHSTQYIVDAAQKMQAKLIYISSFLAADKTSVYGQTKKNSENCVQESGIRYCILRPSLLLGYSPNTVNDRFFNRILKNIDEGIPAAYDSSWKLQPTSLAHLNRVLQEVINRDIYDSVIHIATPETSTHYHIAKDILKRFSISVEEVNKQDTSLPMQHTLTELTDLKLPTLSYQNLINEVINEIKHRKVFSL